MTFTPFYQYTLSLTFAVLNCLLVLFTVKFKWPERQIFLYAFIVNNKVLLYCTVSADRIALMVNRLLKGWMLSLSKEVVGTILMFLSHCYCYNVRTKSSHHHCNLVLLLVLLLSIMCCLHTCVFPCHQLFDPLLLSEAIKRCTWDLWCACHSWCVNMLCINHELLLVVDLEGEMSTEESVQSFYKC